MWWINCLTPDHHRCILPQSSCLEQSLLCRRARPTTSLSPRVSAEWWPCLRLWSSVHQLPELGSSTVHTAPRCFPHPWPPPHLESHQCNKFKRVLLWRRQKCTQQDAFLLVLGLGNIALVLLKYHFMIHSNVIGCVCVYVCVRTPRLLESSHSPQRR